MRTAKIPQSAIDNLFVSSNLIKLFEMYEKYGFEIRIIGGAVRDLLLKGQARDIDLATDATPTESLYLLNEEEDDLEVVGSWGIRHGTVVAAFTDEEQYEITSLDFSISVQNGKIIISQKPNWEDDAKRRDFTVNAMSMDKHGKVFDYLNGIEDLKKEEVKFIGDYKEVIQDSPIVIFRFFKLLGKFKNPTYDKNIIPYIKENVSLIKSIKDETIKWFIVNTKNQPYGMNAIKLMEEAGIYVQDFVESKSILGLYLQRAFVGD